MAEKEQDLWYSVLADWRPHMEKPVVQDELAQSMQAMSIPTFGFFFMLSMATAIATFGMLANSAPAIIGAMIIAPLMAPIMSLAFGLVCIEWRMIVPSILSILSGIALVIAFAYLCTEIVGLRIAGSEILGRTAPTLLDLGVALAAGAAGAFAHTRKSIMNSIAGVAIAVALVPPLTVVGIGLSLGYGATGEDNYDLSEIGYGGGGFDIAKGASILFVTNIFGIVLVAMIVFILNRYGRWKQALVGVVALFLATFLIIGPLNHGLYRLYIKNAINRALMDMVVEYPELLADRAKVNRISINKIGDRMWVDMDVTIDRDEMGTMQEQVNAFHKLLSARMNQEIGVVVTVINADFEVYVPKPERPAEPSDTGLEAESEFSN